MREEGLLSRRSSATLLSSVTDVKSRVPFIGGRLGFGDLTIYTQSGEAGADTFSSITRPIAFRDAVMEGKVRGDAGGRAKPVAAPAPQRRRRPRPRHGHACDGGATGGRIPETIAKLAALRNSGAITPAEFDAKKAEILARV